MSDRTRGELLRFAETLTPLYVGFLLGTLVTAQPSGDWFIVAGPIFIAVAFLSQWATRRREQLAATATGGRWHGR